MLLPIHDFSSSDCAKKMEPYASRIGLGIILLAFLLSISSFNRGLQSDDFIHRFMLSEQNASLAYTLNHFYEFLNPYDTIPWWTQDGLKIKFWRPLSALSHWLDYQLWPDSPLLMHAHSGLWYALLCALVLSFFKKFLPVHLVLLAGLIFALDFNHFANLSWIANRNSLIVACFILLALNAYLDWRTSNKLANICASFSFFMLALASGEAAVVFLACIFIFEGLFFLLPGKSTATEPAAIQRLPSTKSLISVLVLFLSIFTVWLKLYSHFGFGTANNSMYFSPGEDLLFSLNLLFQKTPVFIFGSLFGIEGFYNVFSPEIKLFASSFCLIVICMLFYLSRRLFDQKVFLFFLLCAIASLIPVSFVAVNDMRLSLFSSIFSAGMLALIVSDFNASSSKLKHSLLLFLLISHLIVASGQWLFVGVKDFFSPPQPFSRLIELQKEHPGYDLYLLNYPSPIDTFYLPFANPNTDNSVKVLTNNFSNYTLNAVSKHTLQITDNNGLIFKTSDFDTIPVVQKPLIHGVYARASFNGMLSKDFHFNSGESYTSDSMKILIKESNEEGRATNIDFIIQNKVNDYKILLWNSKEKKFSVLESFPFQTNVNNW